MSGVAPCAAAELYRPLYHFTPARNWINDPNGLVYWKGWYHLFYQYNPFGDRWGHMSWGHARSADLLHWQELPVAIPEDPATMIFSGSIVVDVRNTSGFGNGTTPLVAIYTGAGRDDARIQSQQLAYSTDGSRWTKYAANPVLDLKSQNFRDPKVFWYEPDHEWVMAAVLSDEHKVAFFGSRDLKAWRPLSDFGPAGEVDGAWECPDLFALPAPGAEGGMRWVLKVDVFKSAAAGSGAQYFVGRFDGRTYLADPDGSARAVDYGRDFYAAASWANLEGTGRHVWIAWMNNHEYAQDLPTTPWRGAMSLPREVALRHGSAGYELLQSPIVELERLRVRHRRLLARRIERGASPLALRLAESAEILATLEAGDAREFGLEVRVGPREKTVIGYDAGSQRLFVDRSHSGRVDFSGRFPGRHYAPLALRQGMLTLHLLLDRSSLEVFADDGARVLTEQIFPSAQSLGLQAYASGGTAALRRADLWDLDPARR